MASDLEPHQSPFRVFQVEGTPVRFGKTADGRVYGVASDLARRFDYASTQKALQVVEDDEKGLTSVVTPGGTQQVSVIFEDGIIELMFRSSKPEARKFKKRVKAILREVAGEMDELELAERHLRLVKEKRALLARAMKAEQTLAIAAPKADAWEVLAESTGDYSVREAAYILNRDPNIRTGQNRLFDFMKELKVIDKWKRPYQKHDTHVCLRTTTYRKPGKDEDDNGKQVRVTIEGLRYLHRKLGGTAPFSSLLGGDVQVEPAAPEIPQQRRPETLFDEEDE